MKRLKKICFVVLVGLLITGCAGTYKTLSLGNIEKNNKTITINGINAEIFEIKVALVKNGWKIKIDNQEVHTKGILGKNIDVRTKISLDTKYRMYVYMAYWPRIDMPIASYNITIVENETNFEILSLVAKRQTFNTYSSEDIAERLITELQKIEK